MAATKDLTAVTLQLEVKNGVDKNDQPKFKNISYGNLDTKSTADQLSEMGKEFGGLMEETPNGLYVVERHQLTEGTSTPFSYHDKDGNLTGFDIEIGKAVAKKLGVKPVFIETK